MIDIIKAVWDHSRQSGTKRLVMIAIADMTNADGYCWPGIERIAKMCKCSKRYIMKIIPDLESSGELFVDHRPGRTRGNVYFVTVNVTVDEFAKRLIHYLDYGPTEALQIALTHLSKGEHNSQKVNYGSSLTPKLKVNHSREKVNHSREKVNHSREKVNHSSPDPIEPIEPTIDPPIEGARIASTDPAPAPAAPETKKPLLPNDSYDMPDTSQSSSPRSRRSPSHKPPEAELPHFDPRKLVNGYIPAEKGATAIEVYYERYTVKQHLLTGPERDDIMREATDLDRWRAAVGAWSRSGHKVDNLEGMLDWYRYPERIPSNRFANQNGGSYDRKNGNSGRSNGAATAQNGKAADHTSERKREYDKQLNQLRGDDLYKRISEEESDRRWTQLAADFPEFWNV